MSGLAALLDDIAALARLAAASVDDVAAAAGRATAKAAGVVVDDTAVTPQYVRGLEPARELPIIWRITKGSLINKLVFITPAILLLSQFAPWVLPPLLMVGGGYLCFEGAEKLWHMMRPSHDDHHAAVENLPSSMRGPEAEKKVASGAIRTDFILSTEIMVIANSEIGSDVGIWMRAASLLVVAIGITALVYGVVAIIVKMDDVGLRIAERPNPTSQRLGLGIVRAMPRVLSAISFIGMLAMLWVGGHIILTQTYAMGLEQPYGWVHGVEEQIAHALAFGGGLVGWLFNTACSLVIGFILGTILMWIIEALPFGKKKASAATGEGQPDIATHAHGSVVPDDEATER